MRTDPTAPLGFDEDHETFRNELASVHADGRRKWVYARKPSGRFYTARTLVSYVLLALLLFGAVRQARTDSRSCCSTSSSGSSSSSAWSSGRRTSTCVVLCVAHRVRHHRPHHVGGRAHLVRLALPADHLPGDAVPEDRVADRGIGRSSRCGATRADHASTPLWRKTLKHAIFFALSFLIANVFLAYIIGADTLWTIVTDPPRAAPRRPVRDHDLQPRLLRGVRALPRAGLHARLSLRPRDGRPRRPEHHHRDVRPRPRRAARQAARGRAEASASGDCIDCDQCVTVCPTGIDIRNGIQLECVDCTACIDACDDVMRRVSRPAGPHPLHVGGGRAHAAAQHPQLAREGLCHRLARAPGHGRHAHRAASGHGRPDPAAAGHAADHAGQRRRRPTSTTCR